MINAADTVATRENGRGIDVQATDFSGQKRYQIVGYPKDATIGDLVRVLVARMGLRRADPQGRPYTYHARLDRAGRHLLESEVVGEVLETSGDTISLAPNIDAG